MRARKSLLVRNDEGSSVGTKKQIQNLTLNLLPKLVRHDEMEGRKFLVVPMVILTEGVHNGSEGPLYYPPEELSKTPVIWNHKPVVVYHPEINGQGVSACDPVILTAQKVGVMMNTKYDKGRLKSEAWIEVDRANKIDDRIMASIEAGEMMELSTGIFMDCEAKEGKWQEEDYVGVARNFRPDHLALLPDKIGACSIKDGAGFCRNQEGGRFQKAFQNFLRGIGVGNELSHNTIQNQLSTLLRKKLNVGDNGPYCWVTDVYNDFFIYEMENKLYRLGYSSSDTGVTLDDGKPAEVVRVTEYRTVTGAFVGNQDQNKGSIMDKKKVVDAIIAAGGSWSEADREELMAFNEKQLGLIQNRLPKKEEPKKEETPATPPQKKEETVAATTNTQTTPATPAPAPKVVSVDDYINQAPPGLREVLRNGVDTLNEEKARLVEGILQNKTSGFTKEELEAVPLGNLRKMARLAGVGAPAPRSADYGGMGEVPASNAKKEEPLGLPTMNFEKAK